MSQMLYFLVGLGVSLIGIFIVIMQVKFFLKKDKDELGFEFGLLGAGICALILGIALIEYSFN